MTQTAIAKEKPDWAGEDWLSRLVNVLIKTKPLYSLMKLQARQVLIKTAEKNRNQPMTNFYTLTQFPLQNPAIPMPT